MNEVKSGETEPSTSLNIIEEGFSDSFNKRD